eukprot:421610_1
MSTPYRNRGGHRGAVEPASLKLNIEKHPLSDLCTRIFNALTIDYDNTAANQALTYINNEIETSDELIDDLEEGHEDSGLVDCIMRNACIHANDAPKLLNLLITAVNGDWVATIGKIKWHEDIVDFDTTNNIKLNPTLQTTKEWLCKQDTVFESIHQHLDLIKLFAIGKKYNMPNLPSMLHEIFGQWKINYLIDRKNKGKKLNRPFISDFIRKSKAFAYIHQSNTQLLTSALKTYGRQFSPGPQPVIDNSWFKIDDNLYIFVLYSYIMSEVVNNLIRSQSFFLPFQLDFWIIPNTIQSLLIDVNNEDTDSDDELSDNETKYICHDTSILNIEERLKLEKGMKYEKLSVEELTNTYTDIVLVNAFVNITENMFDLHVIDALKILIQLYYSNCLEKVRQCNIESVIMSLQQKLQGKIEQLLQCNDDKSHNRLVCIVDRRDKYYDFKLLDTTDCTEELFNGDALGIPLIEIDQTKKVNIKNKDEIFIFQPPRGYGSFHYDFSYEHLRYLSKEYMLPKCVLMDPKGLGYKTNIYGTYNDFDQQMFTLSYCCYSKSNIRLQWFINRWNMRISKLNNFVKIWPEYFVENEQNINIEEIKKNVLKRWKLPIVNKEYQAYEKDLLRFHKSNR